MNAFSDFKEVLFYSDEDSRKRRCVRGPAGDADWGVTIYSEWEPGKLRAASDVTVSISGFVGVKIGQTIKLTGGTTGTFVVLRDDKRRGWTLRREFVNEARIAQALDARVCAEYYARQRQDHTSRRIYLDGRYFEKSEIQAIVSRESKRLWAEREAAKVANPVVYGPVDDPDFV